VFDVDPILWLQSWSSPTLTAVMNGISLLGYTRAYIVFAVVLAFVFRQRASIALLVLIGLNGAFTDIAKAAVATPRPDWSSNDVRALSLFTERLRARDPDTPTEIEDTYGFPSGHVSATTAFFVGCALLFKWRRRGWLFAAAAVGAMAISRMYLGRHFLADVVGGVGVGMVAVGLGFGILKLANLAREARAHDPHHSAHRVMVVAAVMAGSALLVGLPDAGDAGRLLGTATGVLVLVRRDVFEFARTRTARAILLTTAAAAFGAAWAVMTFILNDLEPSSVSAMRLAVSALPSAAVLIAPAYLPRHFALWRRSRAAT
jgi:membrane-associated phospholipid phosphatase